MGSLWPIDYSDSLSQSCCDSVSDGLVLLTWDSSLHFYRLICKGKVHRQKTRRAILQVVKNEESDELEVCFRW